MMEILNSLVINDASSFTQSFMTHVRMGSKSDCLDGAMKMSSVNRLTVISSKMLWLQHGDGANFEAGAPAVSAQMSSTFLLKKQ